MATPPPKSSGATPPRDPTGNSPPPEKPGPSDDPNGKKSFRRGFSSKSPPRRPRSRHRNTDKPRERVVERVIRDSGSTGTWPQLTKTNYVEWALRMKLKLQARDLWDVVEFGNGDFRDDRTTLDAICSTVPPEMIPALTIKETASEAWEAIKTLRLGDEKRRVVTAQTLRAEYETIKLLNGESIKDFALRFSGVVQRLAELGDPEPGLKAVKKYLRVVRPRYKQLVVTMEAFVDLSTLSIEEITGTLKSSDDADEEVTPPANSSTGKLLLTHEEWLERSKQDGGCGGSSSGEKRDHKNCRGKGGGDGAGRGASHDPNKSSSTPCFKCHQVGHWARYYPNKAKKKEQAHTAQVE
jgi:hypothetical protein